jgi:hypothetical protein
MFQKTKTKKKKQTKMLYRLFAFYLLVTVAFSGNECPCHQDDDACQVGVCALEVQTDPNSGCNDMYTYTYPVTTNTTGNVANATTTTRKESPCRCLDKIYSCYKKFMESVPSAMTDACIEHKCFLCSSTIFYDGCRHHF